MANRKDNKNRVLHKGESQRSDNTYMYRYTDEFTGKRKYIYDSDLSRLREKEKKIQRDIESGLRISEGQKTLNEQFETIMSLKNVQNTTRSTYLSYWKCQVKDSIGYKALNCIKKTDILFYMKDLQEKGLSRNAIHTCYMLINECLELAYEDDIIRKNPCVGCWRDIKLEQAKKKTPLTDEQLEIFLNYVRETKVYTHYYPMIVLMTETAMRCSEVCGLTWQDVDFENKTISINHQLIYTRENGKCFFCIHETKTESGNRKIPLTNKAYKALFEQRNLQISTNTQTNVTIDGYSDFVFSTKNKTPFISRHLNSAFSNIVKSYNKVHVGEELPHISPHILRHTACTNMAMSGMNLKTLQYVMGHSDISTTMNIYAHSDFEKTRAEMSKWENERNQKFIV